MTLKTLETALGLLGSFSMDRPVWGARELSAERGMSHSVVHRILATYERMGFMRQNPDSRKYELGPKFWEYGLMFRERFLVIDSISPILDKLAEDSGETAYLNLLANDETICVQIAESNASVKVAITLGSRAPLIAGSRGKVLLAFLPEAQRSGILAEALKREPPRRHTDLAGWEAELAAIRAQGWCCTNGERLDDVVGISVPLFRTRDQVFASLTLGGPDIRMTPARIEQCVALLAEAGPKVQALFRMSV